MGLPCTFQCVSYRAIMGVNVIVWKGGRWGWNYLMRSAKLRNPCLQEFSVSSSISRIKYHKSLQQQFITCDDISIERARQKAHHIFIVFWSVQTKKLFLGTGSDKLDGHFTLACWPPKCNVLHIKKYCCLIELYFISYLFGRFKDLVHSYNGFFLLYMRSTHRV